MNIRSQVPTLVLGGALLLALPQSYAQSQVGQASTPQAAGTHARDHVSGALKHKMECWKLGKQAIKDDFPDGINTVAAMNKGMMYYAPEFGYSPELNTCVMLLGYQLTNFKTNAVTTYHAEITDLLSNKTLAIYAVVAGVRLPASLTRAAFLTKAQKLLGDPLPKWLLSGPVRLPPKPALGQQ